MHLILSRKRLRLSAWLRCFLPALRVPCGLALFLLCLTLPAGAFADNDNSSNLRINAPIYVDYDRALTPSPAEVAATNGLGYWIWDKQTLDKQTIHLWQSFVIPQSDSATNAELRISADNAFRVWIDGREIGSGSDWRTLSIYQFSGQLNPGTHVLAVEGFNDCDKAGVIVGMSVKLAKGGTLHLASDTRWRVVPTSISGWQTITKPSPDWPSAVFVAHLRQPPWWGTPKTVAYIQESLPEPVPFWQTSRFQFILFAVCGVVIVVGLCLLIQLVIQSRTHRFLEIERDRIARDIHDDLGSKITQLLLIGEASQIRHNAASPDGVTAEPVLQMCDGARDILTTIDEIIWIVNSQHNTLNDLAIHVCKYTERFMESTAIRFRFDVEYELPPKTLPQLARRNLFLAVKEALNNAVKHSHATELTVRIKLDGSTFIIILEDNGIGFGQQQVNPERNGLNNLMLRMSEIGGHSTIASRPGEGCRVSLVFPLKKTQFTQFLFKPAGQYDFAPHAALKTGGDLTEKPVSPVAEL